MNNILVHKDSTFCFHKHFRLLGIMLLWTSVNTYLTSLLPVLSSRNEFCLIFMKAPNLFFIWCFKDKISFLKRKSDGWVSHMLGATGRPAILMTMQPPLGHDPCWPKCSWARQARCCHLNRTTDIPTIRILHIITETYLYNTCLLAPLKQAFFSIMKKFSL